MQTDQPAAVKGRGCLAKIAVAIGVVIFVLVLILGISAWYETSARADALRAVSPPGELVDVGGHKLHLLCQGEVQPGQPTVILESGAGGWSIHWNDLQQAVAQFARVCSYDRAGFGWSEAGPDPRDGAQIAAELHTLLANAGEPGPFVLVGASRGGQYARIFTHAYPEAVAGLVLLDAEPEEFRSQAAAAQSLASQNQAIFSVVGLLTRLGIFRLLGGDPASAPEMPCIPFAVKHLPPELHAAYVAVEGQPQCFDALLAEEAATGIREEQVRAAGDLGDLPLVVLAHGADVTPAGIAPADAAATEAVWRQLQEAMATLSSAGQLVIAENSGHNIALDQPDLVLAAIQKVLSAR